MSSRGRISSASAWLGACTSSSTSVSFHEDVSSRFVFHRCPLSSALTSSHALLFTLDAISGAASNPDNTESNLYTYDIFIRHCFGSYFDILKELTHSPKMGEQFNFIGSTATRLSWDTQGLLLFPDVSIGCIP